MVARLRQAKVQMAETVVELTKPAGTIVIPMVLESKLKKADLVDFVVFMVPPDNPLLVRASIAKVDANNIEEHNMPTSDDSLNQMN